MTIQIFGEINQERLRQDQKWGVSRHTPEKWVSILGEAYGEVCKEVCEMVFDGKSSKEYRKELIQVAAVVVAMIECCDALEGKG